MHLVKLHATREDRQELLLIECKRLLSSLLKTLLPDCRRVWPESSYLQRWKVKAWTLVHQIEKELNHD